MDAWTTQDVADALALLEGIREVCWYLAFVHVAAVGWVVMRQFSRRGIQFKVGART